WVDRETGEDEDGSLAEMFAQVSRRGDHLARWTISGFFRCGGVVRCFHQLAPTFAVELSEARPRRRVANHEEAPSLPVAPARCADGRVHDLSERSVRDGFCLEPPHGALSSRSVEEVHVPSKDALPLPFENTAPAAEIRSSPPARREARRRRAAATN